MSIVFCYLPSKSIVGFWQAVKILGDEFGLSKAWFLSFVTYVENSLNLWLVQPYF